ncbi:MULTISPECIES: DUF6414 family protein [Providencia]|uniref:DUF6414 family protein n=1 Tax=Providencia TaxID=586 RepID=UPI0013DF1843|nr:MULTISPECIES: hypothetical protein [Providencia]MDL9989460.1 hypothetical protein [Providencia rettgeri]QIF58537.1 hypothetical protein FVA69_14290 [Providencia sp. 1701011]QIF62566.1 hypothetical protein FVA70_14310 [Providencia sp. 1701091]
MALDSQNTVSLYDFIYLDKPRIYTLLAQLSIDGVQQSLKKINGEKSAETTEKKMEGKGNLGVAAGAVASSHKTTEDASELIESMHDVSWSSPMQLLDVLSELNIIHRGTDGANIGSVILARGGIRIFDVISLRKAIPVLGALAGFQQNNSNLPPKAKKAKRSKVDIHDIEIEAGVTIGMMSGLLDLVDDSLQVDLFEHNGNQTWMTLSSSGMTINSSDLALKYGSQIPGEWYVIGIVDALPDWESGQFMNIPEDMNPLKSGLYEMLDSIRNSMGRRAGSYGVTPLMVFRKAITSGIYPEE